MTSDSRLTISRRFNGPPASGNGGYAAGLLARELRRRRPDERAVEVTLRAPVPLDRALDLAERADGALLLVDDAATVAEARDLDLDLALPRAPSLQQAIAAGAIGRLRAQGRVDSPYRRCFACGVERDAHDGLRITPSPVGDDGMVAADWMPHPGLAGDDGRVPDEVVWAALDCPAGIAWSYRLPEGTATVTGRIAMTVLAPVETGRRLVVAGWPIARDRRKLQAGTALFDAQGKVLAYSLQLWLLPRDAQR